MERFYQKFVQNLREWEAALEGYSMEQLLRQPQEGGWSMGQVYTHLVDGTLRYHLRQVEDCLESGEGKGRRKTFKGFMVFRIVKGFPPAKIKVPPSKTYTPVQPESKEAILAGMRELEDKMKVLLPRFEQDKGGKTAHPALGYLNAKEWYKLILWHFKHHMRQKERLDAQLKPEV